jgi:hypothetical protein
MSDDERAIRELVATLRCFVPAFRSRLPRPWRNANVSDQKKMGFAALNPSYEGREGEE